LYVLMKDQMDGRERLFVSLARVKVFVACVVMVAAVPCLSQTLPEKADVGAIALSNAVDAVKPAAATEGATVSPSAALSVAKLSSRKPLIVVGFAGGFVRSTSTVHGEVELAAHLRERYGKTIQAEVFENHHGDQAYREILRLAGFSNGATPATKKAARIILYGHSWGASEAIAVARRLKEDGVPILLVAEVDGVNKPGEDATIPANVAQAINFYQEDGILHGRRTILAADPAATAILGNIRFSYKDSSVPCPGYPWYTRLLTKPHIEIENDPRVWKQVEALIAADVTP
jgi:hypothetical protein